MAELTERDLTDKDYWRLLASRGTGRFLVLAALFWKRGVYGLLFRRP